MIGVSSRRSSRAFLLKKSCAPRGRNISGGAGGGESFKPPRPSETYKIPSRASMLLDLKEGEEYDVLIIGGGATGAGAALDARLRGLKVACVEREDFASGTSSRSTKLIWGGSRYLVQALVSLFNFDLRLLWAPTKTISHFREEFRMVMNCHKERKFLLDTQPHLTNWLPIAVPLKTWIMWPPPFNYPPAALGALGLFPLFFKFYDGLSGFSCPPSHIMTPSRARRKFPQLANQDIKYCPIFYEGQHDDARTNLAIAQTAAREGATITNYTEVTSLIRGKGADGTPDTKGKVIGATVKDVLTGQSFDVKAKTILFCGGPFTDELRKLEDPESPDVVNGAGGIHIVLPSYYAPAGIGMVDMSTSDGRFLFFIPWGGHVLVGTTDHKQKATMRPEPDESEIRWLLTEAAKYLSPELHMRRKDVLSAWSGIRPLAGDPHTKVDPNAPVSRDHVISHNPDSDIVFVAGGKWTTYREMAQDAVDKLIEVGKLKCTKECTTLTTGLVGKDGYSTNLPITLIQEYGIGEATAHRLSKAYGGRAKDVCEIMKNELHATNGEGKLVPGMPYLDAEVIYAARYEWAVQADDMIARRTRLAFLNKDKAIAAIPRVVELMAKELKWDVTKQKSETVRCLKYMRHFGGPNAARLPNTARVSTMYDITEAFHKVDVKGTGLVDALGVQLVAEMLGHPLTDEERTACVKSTAKGRMTGNLELEDFAAWWNSASFNPFLTELLENKTATHESIEGTGAMFG